jgi:glutamate dehydrogenase (NADP+)
MENMLAKKGDDFQGKTVSVSGSGNVATYAVQKVNHLGGKVVTLSDSSGFVHDPDGIDADKLAYLIDLKQVRRGRISEYADEFSSASFHEGRPWNVPCDIALPCATQNEINEEEARSLLKNGCIGVSEGANMPTELAAIHVFQQAGILYAPSKAANAGGVAVSGLEMSQNSARISWTEVELEKLLEDTMRNIHESCVEYGERDGHVDYLAGANIAGFVKVADAMLSFGHT